MTPRERSWSAAPQTRENESPYPPSTPNSPTSETSEDTTSHPADTSHAADYAPAAETSDPDHATNGPDVDVTADGAGRELASSGYRVGASRAKGPDPYSRFDDDREPPSNVRHFPTRDRELGDVLKLSGLLGPSTKDGSGPTSDPANSSDKTPNEESDDLSKTARSSDDSE